MLGPFRVTLNLINMYRFDDAQGGLCLDKLASARQRLNENEEVLYCVCSIMGATNGGKSKCFPASTLEYRFTESICLKGELLRQLFGLDFQSSDGITTQGSVICGCTNPDRY
jgi:hypothetical protein